MSTWKKIGLLLVKAPLKRIFITSLTFTAIAFFLGYADDSRGDDNSPTTTRVSPNSAISAPTDVINDSDVNDTNEPYIANDTKETAQSLANPITVEGYANQAGEGSEGRSYANGDEIDCFSVDIRKDDIISLAVDDTVNGDLDLYLHDAGGSLIDSSLGTNLYETITAPADGHYFVSVVASSGASNYILAIGIDVGSGSAETAGTSTLSVRHDFVASEAIVRFKGDTRQSAGVLPENRVATMNMTMAAGSENREMRLTFSENASLHAMGANAHFSSSRVLANAFGTLSDEMERKLNTLDVIKALRRRNDVRSADPNYIVHAFATEPNDEFYPLQWNYSLINLPQAWDITTGSSDVIVAVVDTGILLNHPDLAGQLTDDGYDFISDTSTSNDGDGIDPNPDDSGDEELPEASSFHGTHCAGTIAAASNNEMGVAGVSWNTRIMPVRVLGVGGGTDYDVLQGVRYAAGLENDSGTVPDQPADIISLSLGGAEFSDEMQEVFRQVREAGVIVIAAAGNESSSTPAYPASYDGVISVSAVDLNGDLAPYSNYGEYIDVAAPGGDMSVDLDGDDYPDGVASTCGDNSSGAIEFNYRFYEGTSMAAPHVAGVVALMKAVNPALTPEGLYALLQNGALTNDIGDTGRDDNFGYGLIDAYKAVLAADDGDSFSAD
jgi:serine protease